MRTIDEIILHCSATKEGQFVSVDTIRNWHINNNGWKDVGYHFVIYLDGTVMAGRPLEQVGAHAGPEKNPHSIGICYVGGLGKDGKPKDTRTPQQKDALFDLTFILLQRFGLSPDAVHCHNEYANKACPCFSRDEFVGELKQYIESLKNKQK